MDVDDLYDLPLDRFIPERGALAKALRADKQRDEAAVVAALRKPSVAAWAVNQLVRTQGEGVRELFEAGDELRDAQARLLAGRGDGRALRVANERERAAVQTLVEAARGLLSSEGHELGATIVERVGDTLHAAAIDEAAREQVRDGRLERELSHAGLGLGESPGPAPAAKLPRARSTNPVSPAKRPTTTQADQSSWLAKAPPPDAKARRQAADTREQAAEARRAAREEAKRERAERERAEAERAKARKAARTAEAAARRRAERAGHALKAADERRERAAKALEQADEALAEAQSEAHAAAEAQQEAQDEIDRLA